MSKHDGVTIFVVT